MPKAQVDSPGGGGGWVGVGFLRRLVCRETGIDFAQFVMEPGMVFEGTTGVNERIYSFNSK